MNRFAFLSTSFLFKRLYKMSNARVRFSGTGNLPEGPVVFTVNHFTRIETLFLSYHLEELTKRPIWSLAHHSLFKGMVAGFIRNAGAVSTMNPDRDRLIIRSLLTGEGAWLIFPEGSMVKSKKVMGEEGFLVHGPDGRHRPRTGAANLALRSEFYRRRIRLMAQMNPELAEHLCRDFDLESPADVCEAPTTIVPVNLTYYPLRARENIFNWLVESMVDKVSDRMTEEIMTEGSMLLDGVDVDIRFGRPIDVGSYLGSDAILHDIMREDPFGMDEKIASLSDLRQAARDVMEGYMAAIYAMTTVNPDHLFATILRDMPEDLIDPQDLRRRVYLAASQRLDAKRLYLHESLERNAISLLTDDRFGWFADFREYAERIGVLTTMTDGLCLRDSEKIRKPYDAATARIDNPVAVMANEIEPLRVLRPHLERLAREDCYHVQRRLVGHLTHESILRFEEEWLHAPHDLAFLPELGRSRLGGPNDAENGVLLVHGYLSVPAQMEGLAEYLENVGFRVYTVRLPGHGSYPEMLARIKGYQWLDAVDEGFALLKLLCRKVFIVGMSLGGTLALDLASRVPDVAGIVGLGVPYRIRNLTARFAPGEGGWRRILSKLRPRKGRESMIPFEAEYPERTYGLHPEFAVHELAILLERLKSRFGKVVCPVLFLQASRDPVVGSGAARELLESVGAERKELFELDYATHELLEGRPGKRVMDVVAGFLKDLATPD